MKRRIQIKNRHFSDNMSNFTPDAPETVERTQENDLSQEYMGSNQRLGRKTFLSTFSNDVHSLK